MRSRWLDIGQVFGGPVNEPQWSRYHTQIFKTGPPTKLRPVTRPISHHLDQTSLVNKLLYYIGIKNIKSDIQ